MRDSEPIQVIDLVPGGPVSPPEASRSRPVLLALALVAAMAAAVLVLVPDGDAEVAVEEDATTTTAVAERDEGTFPAPLALGAPDDGKESVGLPVRAEPSTGLVDGQMVEVTGTGFPPGEAVGVVMCTREAGRDHGARGAEACNLGRFAQVTADADGVATTSFEVARLVALDGQEIDCASEAQRCLIGMGLISDYDQSGGVLVDFDPTAALPDPPSVTVAGHSPYADGQQVTVQVDRLRPRTAVGAVVCTADGGYCAESAMDEVTGDDGAVELSIRLWRLIPAPLWDSALGGSDIDCAVVACTLQIWGESVGDRAIPQVPLEFTADPIERARPVVEERSTGPYGPGDRMELFLPGAGGGNGAEVVLCSAEQCTGTELAIDEVAGGLRIVATVPSAEMGNPCNGSGCRVFVRAYPPPGDGPPPLSPEPLVVVVEG